MPINELEFILPKGWTLKCKLVFGEWSCTLIDPNGAKIMNGWMAEPKVFVDNMWQVS